MSEEITQAVGAPLERQVRPRAWAWKDEPSGQEVYSSWEMPRPTDGSEPLYDQAAIDAAVLRILRAELEQGAAGKVPPPKTRISDPSLSPGYVEGWNACRAAMLANAI